MRRNLMDMFYQKYTCVESEDHSQDTQPYETPKAERLGEIADLTSDSWTNSVTVG